MTGTPPAKIPGIFRSEMALWIGGVRFADAHLTGEYGELRYCAHQYLAGCCAHDYFRLKEEIRVLGSGFKVQVSGSKVLGSTQPLAAAAASLIEKETNEHRTSNVQH
jgi:hypothetical protein